MPTNHLSDCYFCMVDLPSYKRQQDKRKLYYPNITSSIAPVPHDEHLHIPIPPAGVFADESDIETSDIAGKKKCGHVENLTSQVSKN